MSPTTCAATTGASAPLGATVRADGVNFSIFAGNATRVDLLLFDDANASGPAEVLPLDGSSHRTGGYWHVFVPGLQPGQIYAYRAHGTAADGRRRDGDKVLLDPYGAAVAVPEGYNRGAATAPGGNAACAMKSVVAYLRRYDWQDDRSPQRSAVESVVYELHVRGFTRHLSSGLPPERRGTYRGIVEKIPYLQALGITAVELLPVFQFDPLDAAAGQVNYWGYPPVSFFAPHHGYASSTRPLAALDEFRDMVRALHAAGLEVIVDAVFSHTTEGDDSGPTVCFRGLAGDCYYLRDERARPQSVLNAGHPVVRRLILDSLRHWVGEMHVDGFRLTLPPAVTEHREAQLPLLLEIASDPLLAGTRILWHAGDEVERAAIGRIAGERWQWCDQGFGGNVRRFLKGDDGAAADAADSLFAGVRVAGECRVGPERRVHYVTSHDGFTLNDLVTYNGRHNEANGEGNGDGVADNASWNCGAEGPSADPAIEALRTRQVKNFLALALLGAGTPMLLMGDEVRRSQGGNNNAYCQDNDVSWFDWTLLDRHAEVLRFVTELTALRSRRDVGTGSGSLSLAELLRDGRVSWHGVRLNRPEWGAQSHALAFTLRSQAARLLVHAIVNAYWEPLVFELPPLRPRADMVWRRWIDTALPPPDDIRPSADAPVPDGRRYEARPRSVVVLALERHGRGQTAQVPR